MENRIESEAKFWNSVATKIDNVVEKRFPKTYEFIFDHLTDDTAESDELLEIATGTGIIAIKPSEHISNITAIDISHEMLKVAQEKCAEQQIANITLNSGMPALWEFEDKTFYTVMSLM